MAGHSFLNISVGFQVSRLSGFCQMEHLKNWPVAAFKINYIIKDFLVNKTVYSFQNYMPDKLEELK